MHTGYYFHSLFLASIPVKVVGSVTKRGTVRVELPSGERRVIRATFLSEQPVDGFPIRRDI